MCDKKCQNKSNGARAPEKATSGNAEALWWKCHSSLLFSLDQQEVKSLLFYMWGWTKILPRTWGIKLVQHSVGHGGPITKESRGFFFWLFLLWIIFCPFSDIAAIAYQASVPSSLCYSQYNWHSETLSAQRETNKQIKKHSLSRRISIHAYFLVCLLHFTIKSPDPNIMQLGVTVAYIFVCFDLRPAGMNIGEGVLAQTRHGETEKTQITSSRSILMMPCSPRVKNDRTHFLPLPHTHSEGPWAYDRPSQSTVSHTQTSFH